MTLTQDSTAGYDDAPKERLDPTSGDSRIRHNRPEDPETGVGKGDERIDWTPPSRSSTKTIKHFRKRSISPDELQLAPIAVTLSELVKFFLSSERPIALARIPEESHVSRMTSSKLKSFTLDQTRFLVWYLTELILLLSRLDGPHITVHDLMAVLTEIYGAAGRPSVEPRRKTLRQDIEEAIADVCAFTSAQWNITRRVEDMGRVLWTLCLLHTESALLVDVDNVSVSWQDHLAGDIDIARRLSSNEFVNRVIPVLLRGRLKSITVMGLKWAGRPRKASKKLVWMLTSPVALLRCIRMLSLEHSLVDDIKQRQSRRLKKAKLIGTKMEKVTTRVTPMRVTKRVMPRRVKVSGRQ